VPPGPLSLPTGTTVEDHDTLAAYTARGTCAGYGVWGEDGATFAVALYNVLGQLVRTLYDQTAHVGREHEIQVSTDHLSSGTRTQRFVVVAR